MGQELDPFAPLTDLGKDVANDIIVYLQPKLMEIVKDASKTAEPMIRTVVREEVLPKVGLFTVSGMVMVGIESLAMMSAETAPVIGRASAYLPYTTACSPSKITLPAAVAVGFSTASGACFLA